MLNKLFCNKKSQGITTDLILVLLQFVILLSSLVAIGMFIQHHLSQTSFEKNYLAKDIALLANTVYAAPANIVAYYMYDKFDASFESKTGEYYRVKIDDSKNDPRFYPFGVNEKLYNFGSSLELKEKIQISKITGVFYGIKPDKDRINPLELECSELTIINNRKPIMIDAGHSKVSSAYLASEHGFKEEVDGNSLIEGNIVGELADSLISGKTISTTYDDGRRKSQDEIIELIADKDPQLIISLHIGSYESQLNNVKAYYSIDAIDDVKEQTKKLACLILNRISASVKEISGTSIVPIHEEDYENAIFPENKVAILLEIGNIKSKDGQEMFQKGGMGNIESAIKTVLKEVYNE